MYILFTIAIVLFICIVINKSIVKTFKRIMEIEIRGWYIMFIAGLIRFGMNFLTFNIKVISINDYPLLFNILNATSLILCIIFIGMNLRGNKGLGWVIAGVSMNALVIISNGGKMPVDTAHIHLLNIPDISEALLKGEVPFHIPLTDTTLFPYFADVIPIVNPSFSPVLLSLGDIFAILGTFIFIYNYLIIKPSLE